MEPPSEVPASIRDEALARDGVSREVPCSALKGETPKSIQIELVEVIKPRPMDAEPRPRGCGAPPLQNHPK